MAVLGAHELLQAWEHGLSLSPTNRALTLLATASPGTPLLEIARLPIGERDLGLLRLRSALFGDWVEAVCSCPSCGEQLDVSFDARKLAGDELAAATEAPASWDGHEVTVRAPNSLDLLALAGETDLPTARRGLLLRCLGNSGPDLPNDVAEALVSQIADLDPRARIDVRLSCVACGHAWSAVFDVAGFLWAEIHAWAHRTLRDVHVMACAYGWHEGDILAMSPARRQGYLELIGS